MSVRQRYVAFRRPAADEAGAWTSSRARSLPLPLQYDTLRTMATELFPPTRYYKVALGYNLAAGAEVMLMDDADAAPFGDAVAAGLLTEPIIINVHHLRYGKNGEIAARKIAKKVLKAGTLGEHVKLDHPARRKQLSRKARDEDDLMDVVKRESNGYGYQQRGEGYRPPPPPPPPPPVQTQRHSSESSDASVEVLDGPPVEARPSSRKGRYKNAPSSSAGSASRGSKDSRGIAQDSSSGSTSRGTKDSGSASTSKASKRARP